MLQTNRQSYKHTAPRTILSRVQSVDSKAVLTKHATQKTMDGIATKTTRYGQPTVGIRISEADTTRHVPIDHVNCDISFTDLYRLHANNINFISPETGSKSKTDDKQTNELSREKSRINSMNTHTNNTRKVEQKNNTKSIQRYNFC